jgi:hypothetical protein
MTERGREENERRKCGERGENEKREKMTEEK